MPTALDTDKDVDRKESGLQSYPVEDDVTIYKGALVCVNSSGYLVPGEDAASYRFVGIAYEKCDNTLSGHSQGGKSCRVHTKGVFKLVATGLTQAMVGQMMYLTDDQTVDATTGGTYYIPVGRLVEYVTATSGWVDIGQRHLVGGADDIMLAPDATKKFEVHTWGAVLHGSSLYMATDYGAYINSWAAGKLEICASNEVRMRIGGKGFSVLPGGVFSSGYEMRLTGHLNVVAGTLTIPSKASPVTQPSHAAVVWYNEGSKKLQFSTDTGMETVTSTPA